MSLRIITQPTAEPVTLAEVKSRLRLTDTADDTLITAQITIAREYVERILGRSLAVKTYAAFYEKFPCIGHPLILPVPPTTSVSAVKYLDPTTQTWLTWDNTEYLVGAMQEPAVIVEVSPNVYPPTVIVKGYSAVEVDLVSGVYTGPGASVALEAIRQITFYLYQNPDATEASYPVRAINMIRSFKLYGF